MNNIAKDVWSNPELGLKENYSADLLSTKLRKEGFSIESGVGDMDTAFIAEYGSGSPIIGILGEYDALPGLSQKVKVKPDPVNESEPGHGCGHNLLGTAGLGASLAVKQLIEKGMINGRVRYYGCPAEETLVGKVFMARSGAFDDLDACLTWHPGGINATWTAKSLAMNSVRFVFSGKSAHAAASPSQGRSALDAVELMNTGVEYMREHISDKARIHYSIPEGGEEPNVVPEKAIVWYYIRAQNRDGVDFLYDWIKDIADAAANMARVEREIQFLSGCYDTLANMTLADLLLDNMKQIGGPNFSSSEVDFARDIEKTFNPGQKDALTENGIPEELIEVTLHEDVVSNHYDEGRVSFGSTDVGDVSWIVPLAQFTAATWPVGTASHSWQATASAGSNIGLKGMLFASKVMATTAVDLYSSPEIISEAKREFTEKTKNQGYNSPLPGDIEPPYDQLD